MTLVLPECKSAPLYEEINSLVIEYLELNGLEKTIATFSSECRSRSLPGPFNNPDDTKAAFSYYDGEKLLKCFDEGNLETFVKLWKSFQGHVQVTTDDMKKLEVYLRVHFALWPCAHGEPDAVQTQAMNSLKVFFEEQSCQLSHDATILPLFALPYVADPKNHPIFRDLFQPNWSQRLRAQLEATLLKYFDLLQQNLGVHSKLAAIVLNSNSKDLNFTTKSEDNGNNSLSTIYHRDRFFQLVSTYRQARKLLKNTRESYGKLLKIANELIIGLEASVGGQKLSLEPIMKKCYEIFPELFTPIDTNGVIGQPDKEYFKRLAHSAQFDNIIDSDVSLFFIGISDMSPDNLDYKKIKLVLRNEETQNGDKLCLLQSLRWLLTKSTPKCRQTALNSFIDADILGLHAQTETYRSKLFDCLLSQNPTYLKECFTRILNTIASMKSGRAYMGKNTYCVDYLVKSLSTFRGLNESYICQMVIATLQKLSLKKQMRLAMIERNVIPWLVQYLKNEFDRSGPEESSSDGADQDTSQIVKYYNPYLMEYAWALLMNLCLHEESNEATSSIANDIISCVTQMLLSKPTREVYPYVISTLYSLLRNPDIFAAAQQMGVQNLFANCSHIDDTEMSHHFSHVTAILQTQGYDRVSTTTGEVDYDDDDDIDPSDFEPEIEVAEAWEESLPDSNMTGDDLLMRKYLIVNETNPSSPCIPSPTPQTATITRKRNQRPTGVFNRPTTPSSAYQQRQHHNQHSASQQRYDYSIDDGDDDKDEECHYYNHKKRQSREDRDRHGEGEQDRDSNKVLEEHRVKPSVRSPSLSPNARESLPHPLAPGSSHDTLIIPAYPKVLAATAVLEKHSPGGQPGQRPHFQEGALDGNQNDSKPESAAQKFKQKQIQQQHLPLSSCYSQIKRKQGSETISHSNSPSNFNSNSNPVVNCTKHSTFTIKAPTNNINANINAEVHSNTCCTNKLPGAENELINSDNSLNERYANNNMQVINTHITNLNKLLASNSSNHSKHNKSDGIISTPTSIAIPGGKSPRQSNDINNNSNGTNSPGKRQIPRLLEKKPTKPKNVCINKESFADRKSAALGDIRTPTTTTTQPG